MIVRVRLERTERADVEIDTADYPEETAGWDDLSERQLYAAATAAAWEIVGTLDWDESYSDEEVRSVER